MGKVVGSGQNLGGEWIGPGDEAGPLPRASVSPVWQEGQIIINNFWISATFFWKAGFT